MEEQKTQNNTRNAEENPSNPLQHQEVQPIGMEITSTKRTHGSEGSDSDKDSPITSENQLSIVTTLDIGGWQKVEKKKGRKE